MASVGQKETLRARCESVDYICGSEPSVQRGELRGCPFDGWKKRGHGKTWENLGQKKGEKPWKTNRTQQKTTVFAIRWKRENMMNFGGCIFASLCF